MITFGLNYDVKQEFVEKFLKVSYEAIELMGTLKGHQDTKLYSDVKKPNSFLIYSEWETQEDLKNFMRSEAFKTVQTMGIEMLEARPKHKMYETKSMH
ncbi:MAG: antibiotic biosynthesis monooxygenase [Candidatus Sericytochromatia bacterium]